MAESDKKSGYPLRSVVPQKYQSWAYSGDTFHQPPLLYILETWLQLSFTNNEKLESSTYFSNSCSLTSTFWLPNHIMILLTTFYSCLSNVHIHKIHCSNCYLLKYPPTTRVESILHGFKVFYYIMLLYSSFLTKDWWKMKFWRSVSLCWKSKETWGWAFFRNKHQFQYNV